MSDSDGSMTVEGGLNRAAMYRAAIETSTDGFHLLDGEGRILEVNNAYLQRSGYTREELLGMRVDDLDARESPDETAAHIRRVRSEGSDIFETLHRTRDGRLWQVEITVSYWDIEGGRFFCFLRDIAGRKRSEALLRTRVELSALAESGTIDDLLQHALDAAELHTGSNIGFFHFVDRDQERLTLQTWSTNTLKSMCTAAGRGKHYPISEAGVWVECFHRKEPVIHNDYEALPQRKGMPSGHAPVMRELVVPLMREGRVVAIIGVGNKTTDYLPEDVQAVEEIASLVMDSVIRKRVEAELRESQERLSRAQQVARLGNWEWDFLANRWYWSEVNYRIFGVAPGIEPSYDVFIGTVKPAERELVNQAFADALAGKRRFNIDYTIIRPDSGQPRIINSKADVIRDAKGSPIRMVGTVQDITRRKKVEDALRHSESLYHDLVETAQDLIWQCDAEGRYTYLNPAWEAVFGYPVREMLGRKFTDFQDPVTARHDQQAFMSLLEGGLVKGYETVHRSRDGHDIHLVFNAKCVRDSVGNIVGTRGTAYDITERKRVEEALRESEQLYRNLVETTDAVAWEVDIFTLRFTYISPRIADLSGYPPEQWTGYSFWVEKIHPDDREYASGFCQAETAKGLDHAFEYRMIAADGTTVWVRDVVSVVLDQGRPVTLRGYFINITERRIAEDKVRQSEKFVRSLLDTVDEGFIVIDRDYRILTANKAYCSQVGGCDETVIGSHCYEISHKIARPCYEEGEECAVRQVFDSGQPHASLHRHRDAHGNIIYVETKAYPILDAAGGVNSVIETISNITEKYLLEEERLKTQKLESIGTLAGGIAHDFNNLLQGVFGYISMAKMTLDQRERALTMLEQAEEALHLSVNLTTQLLTFSKGGKPVKKLISLRPAIENAVKFALSGSHTDYRLDIAPDVWQVEADTGQLAQVIQNIVLNANEAMAGSGTVCISVANMQVPSKAGARLPKGGRFVRIDITDTGTGISGQNLARIFDPYFTTKQKGSGLGLATSYSIIRNHGGVIEVTSELEKGSTFTLYLPAATGVDPKPGPPPAAVAGTRKGRILVMDDEDLVRKIAVEMIAALGHEVSSAGDGVKAIELFRQARETGAPYDLLILDLTVKGGMGGEEAIQRILEMDPGAKAVVSSGYADNPVVANYRDHGFSAFLNKPYKLAALQECLDSCLL